MTRRSRPSLIRTICLVIGCLALCSVASTGAAVAQNPVPFINQPLLPDVVKPGGAGFTLTVNGTGFVSGATVHWNGGGRATTFVSGSRLTASILAADIAKVGTASVTVVNPGPGGGTSNVVFFEVTTPSSSIALRAAEFGAGQTATWVSLGDFNGDSKLDLVIAECNANEVSVLLGKGDGTFQVGTNYSVGACPISIAVGDFNRDGKLDLVVANHNSSYVSVLLGNGDGTFQAAVNYAVGTGPGSVAIGDFNRDGKLDLAVTNLGSNDVSVLLGNGDGTFHAAVNYAVPTGPTSVTVGDFNRDGKLDLAIALGNADGTGADVAILQGNGDGTFQAPVNYSTGGGPFSVAAGDFNGDGKLDLVTANAYGSTISVLLGNGDGTFQPHVDYNTGSFPVAVAVADLNGDGKLDLAVANQDSNSVSVLLGNGDGSFQGAVNYAAATSPMSVSPGDFNGGGRLDIAVPDYGNGAASVLLQIPTISLSKTSLIFANQVVGTSGGAQTVTLTNTSGLALTVSAIAVTGTNATDFSQTNTCKSGLPPGGECAVTVTFKPTHIGPLTASVTITDNGADNPQSIALSGTGVSSGSNATLSPTGLQFATQLVHTTGSAQPVTLSNYGTAALSISRITVTGDFAVTSSSTCGNSVAAGASCTINVTFTPSQIGTRSGTLSVADNASGSPQTARLTGTGTEVKFNPASLSFGTVRSPYSRTLTTTLTNTGSTALSITGIASTPNPTFSEWNTCGSSVGAGQSCTIIVTFKPSCLTTRTIGGIASVSDNGGGSPQQVTLLGTCSGYFR